MVYLHWHLKDKISDCLGFKLIRHDARSGDAQPLPALSDSRDKATTKRFKSTAEWPVQKFSWKDLFAPRGGSYCTKSYP